MTATLSTGPANYPLMRDSIARMAGESGRFLAVVLAAALIGAGIAAGQSIVFDPGGSPAATIPGILDMSGNRIDNVGNPDSADDAAPAQFFAHRPSQVLLSHDGYISWDGNQFDWSDRLIVIPAGDGQGTHYNIDNESDTTSADDPPVSMGSWDLLYLRPSDSEVTGGSHEDPPAYVEQYGDYDPQPNDVPIAWVNGDNNFLHLSSGEVLAPGERIDANNIRRDRNIDMSDNYIDNREGLWSSYLSTTQTSVEGGSLVNVYENVDINDATYTKNDGNTVTVQRSGTYRISYQVNIHRTGSSARNVMRSYIRVNGGNRVDRTATACYIRTNAAGDECTNSATVMLDLSSGDTVEVYTHEERGAETGNDIEHARLNMEYLG